MNRLRAAERPTLMLSFPHTNRLTLVPCAFLLGCAASVNDYLTEARRGDPESIQDAIVSVGRLLREKEAQGIAYDAGDEQAIRYLAEVAELGKDAVNRSSALDSLSRLKRPKLTSLYAGRLEDKSWSVQLEAAKALTRNPSPEAVEPLVKRLKEELRTEVRLEILKALAATGGDGAFKALLTAFLEGSGPYADLRLTIYDGLRKLSQTQLAFDDAPGWRKLARERFPDFEAKPAQALAPIPEQGVK